MTRKMNSHFLALLKTKRLGRYCKVGAWSILSLGMFYIVIYGIYTWNLYNQMKSQNNINFPSSPNYFYALPSIAAICEGAIFAIFGFVVLYVAGVIFSTLAVSLAPTRDETEDIVYESIDEPIGTRK